MNIEEVADKDPFHRFVYWIKERHKIYLKKERVVPITFNAKKPWTDDEVLQSYFFTNPYRENDKVTAWFRNSIRDPLKAGDQVVFATIAFRWFNYIPTGEFLNRYKYFTKWNTDTVCKLLMARRAKGEKVFTGAFTISPAGSTLPKIERVCYDFINPVWEDRVRLVGALKECTTLQDALEQLQQYPGLGGGGFMAGQVIADLKHTRMLRNASDWASWCILGPGAIRGLNRLLGRPTKGPKPTDWQGQMLKLQARTNRLLRVQPAKTNGGILCMQGIQHCLCEYDKYERARLGEGHMKRKYNG